jgi:hypothetical protein
MNFFCKNIVIGQDKKARFCFTRNFVKGGLVYSVTVTDKEDVIQNFDMKNLNGKWKIVNLRKLPSWIQLMETEIVHAVINH